MSRRPFLQSLLLLALLPAAALVSGAMAANPAPALVEGTDYEVIAGGKPFAPVKGKVEVVEVFGYTCPHCAHFQPQIAKWQAQNAKQVSFVPMAAPFGGFWTPYAKAFYAAQELGVATRSHDAMFLALHTDGTLPLRNPSVDEIAAFYSRYGVDAQRFASTYDSPQVQARMDKAEQFIRTSGVEGTPMLVVNGKYRILGRSFDDTLRIADQLVARERATR
ncbi:thiol:disulfide interchange protein DsbA/DsbL [Lysobacter arenosi]|jgi:protein dithiol oxidoreductase (disulfide-forming)|uniref:Thiol:disulfide interchange protein n=1 Tax=Lysobacter arenosi TaxID=2795387 RepID=A0ABX7RC70_9GAMM|nr:thiol:disulfide interchange protein DsbA/DsbL [Lysobacter arenosi]QSX74562.1 thiol:disulfide interchange protein DsbA/DsbL [Lysobacter arenosi]